MITYTGLAATPKAFPALTGLTKAEFDRLFREFAAAADAHRAARTHTKRGSRRLRRAAGAGHPHSLDPRTRLLRHGARHPRAEEDAGEERNEQLRWV